MLSICGVDVEVVAVSWNSVVRCINELLDFDVWMTDDVEKAEQVLLSADRNREIARVLLVFMIDIAVSGLKILYCFRLYCSVAFRWLLWTVENGIKLSR